MAGRNKQPVDVLVARGKSHLTRAERDRRKAEELSMPPWLAGVSPPAYLEEWPGLVATFKRYAEMLSQVMPDNFGAPDADCLARYVVAEHFFEKYTAQLMEETDPLNIKCLQIAQDRAFKQAHTASSVLGLNVTSRCKLVVPVADDADDGEEF